jgi:histidinol-phosphate aminotransferase
VTAAEERASILSRRAFAVRLGAAGLGALAAPILAGRGREALAGEAPAAAPAAGAPAEPPIRLDSNENPYGPAPGVVEAIRAALGEAGRYPDAPAAALREAIARAHGVPTECVVCGCGSTEILRMAVLAFTSAGRPLVTAAPSFEDPARYAAALGSPVVRVPVGADLALDLEAMGAKAAGAGLVYVCNPNNPTATVRAAADVRRLVERALADPSAAVLIDEAYHEYVEDPRHATAIPLALDRPRVAVARTFSKVHGMAGLRVGYAVGGEATMEALARHRVGDSINLAGAAAALASLGGADHVARQVRLNREARDLARRFFEGAGFRVGPSETNFLMVDVRRDAAEFRAACRARGVLVGRPFPPLATYARISMGTMDEMRRAIEVFREGLPAG